MKKTVLSTVICLAMIPQAVSAQTVNKVKFSNVPGCMEIVGNASSDRVGIQLLERIYDGEEEERLEYVGTGTVEDGKYSHSVRIYNPQGLYKLKVNDGMSQGISEKYIYMSKTLAADGVNSDMPEVVAVGDRCGFETDIKNYTDSALELCYYAGYYDENDSLIGVDINDISAEAGASSIGFAIEIPPIPGISSVKVMFMDENMHPLGKAMSARVVEHNAVYVSKDGGDGAYTDLLDAISYADTLEGQSVVYLHEGEYEPITISGVSDVILAAYPGENVKFTNTVKLSATDFKPVSDSGIYNRIGESYRDKVKELDLTAQGISGAGVIPKIVYAGGENPYDILTINSQRCEIARYPNEGYTQLYNKTSCDENSMVFKYIYSRGENWLTADEIWVNGFWSNGWSMYSMPATMVKKSGKTVHTDYYYEFTTDGSAGSILGGLPAGRFYVFNIPEEIDVPGEWFIDNDTNKMYVYAGDGFDNADIRFGYEISDAVTIKASKNVGIFGITFEGIKGSAIVSDCDGTKVVDCTVKNVTNDSIIITGSNCLVASNTISNVGSCAISMTGGNTHTLSRSENLIENNEVFDYAKDYKVYNPAIRMAGVGMTARHNKIYNAPHVAIQLSGNEHIIEFNDIRNVLQESGDAGAIYCGRNLLGNGNIIRYNYFEDFERVSFRDEFGVNISYSTVKDVVAIYLDDMFSGATVHGNIMNNVDVGILMGGGSNNVITNNIIMNKKHDDSYSISADARGTDGRDISYIVESAKKIPYTTGLWAYRYPEVLVSMKDENLGVPVNNIIKNNVMYHHNSLDVHEYVRGNGDVSSNAVINTEPGFVDYENGNFNLKEDAYIFDSLPGFENIEFSRIGLNR